MSTLYGSDLFGNPATPAPPCKLAGDFIVPPFSVLNAREGDWQERKRRWISMGIRGEIGRGQNCLGLSGQCEDYRQRSDNYKVMPSGLNFGRLPYDGAKRNIDGTSIFDPVLTELAYRWFVPQGGMILDPFAGGSVRGIVAGILGYKYLGVDLRQEQIVANYEQLCEIAPDSLVQWICGDSMDEIKHTPAADFLFTCPPYGDLERYSDDPRDISTMEYHTFLAAYKRILLRACLKLKDNRFACIVVGDFRDGKGYYRNFVGDTISAFLEIGFTCYREVRGEMFIKNADLPAVFSTTV